MSYLARSAAIQRFQKYFGVCDDSRRSVSPTRRRKISTSSRCKTFYDLEDAFCAKLEIVGNGRPRPGCSIAAVVKFIKLCGCKVFYEARMKPIDLLGQPGKRNLGPRFH